MEDYQFQDLQIKSLEITKKGQFIAIASTDNVDLVKDIVIQEGIKVQYPIDLLLEHESGSVIGRVISGEVQEIDNIKSLLIKGELFLNGDFTYVEKKDILQVYDNLKKNIGQFSIGYRIIKSHKEGEINILDQISLQEISYVMNPANPDTRVLNIKNINENDFADILLKHKSMTEKYKTIATFNIAIDNIKKCQKGVDLNKQVKSILELNKQSDEICNSNVKIKILTSAIRDFEKRCGRKNDVDNNNTIDNEKSNILDNKQAASDVNSSDNKESLARLLGLE